MKQLSRQAQVAKLLKQKAKQLGIRVKSAKSDSFSGGTSVSVRFNAGSDDNVKKFKEYASQFQSGHFDGMYDIYEYSNSRDDIPQTKYLMLHDDRADDILGDKLHYQNEYIANGENVTYPQFLYRLKDQSDNGKVYNWQTILLQLAGGQQHRDFQINFANRKDQ